MTAHEPTNRVTTDSGADAGPGERLREAREAAGLTLGEVSSRLRLEPRAVERLESDDYEALHGPTFVRGYLGSYARLLNLPPQPILEAYERHGYGPPALVSELGRKSEVHVSDFPVRMVTYVIAGLLVVLVVLWWQSRKLEEAPPARAGAEETRAGAPALSAAPEAPASEDTSMASATAPRAASMPMPGDDAAPPTPADAAGAPTAHTPQTTDVDADGAEAPAPGGPGDARRSAPEPEAVAAAEAPDTQPAPEPAAAPGNAPTASAEAAAQSVAAASESASPPDAGGDGRATPAGTESTQASGADADVAAASTAEPAPAPRPEPLPGSDVLAIQLARESWIEIYDRGGGRLYYSLAKEGSQVVVTGAGPMRVLLGEAEGAEVAYNGEPFDLTRFKGHSVVRFTVGESPPEPATAAPPTATPQAAEEPLTGESRPPASAEKASAVADARARLEPEPVAPPARKPAPIAEPMSEPAAPPALEPAGNAAGDGDVEPAIRVTRPDS